MAKPLEPGTQVAESWRFVGDPRVIGDAAIPTPRRWLTREEVAERFPVNPKHEDGK